MNRCLEQVGRCHLGGWLAGWLKVKDRVVPGEKASPLLPSGCLKLARLFCSLGGTRTVMNHIPLQVQLSSAASDFFPHRRVCEKFYVNQIPFSSSLTYLFKFVFFLS